MNNWNIENCLPLSSDYLKRFCSNTLWTHSDRCNRPIKRNSKLIHFNNNHCIRSRFLRVRTYPCIIPGTENWEQWIIIDIIKTMKLCHRVKTIPNIFWSVFYFFLLAVVVWWIHWIHWIKYFISGHVPFRTALPILIKFVQKISHFLLLFSSIVRVDGCIEYHNFHRINSKGQCFRACRLRNFLSDQIYGPIIVVHLR